MQLTEATWALIITNVVVIVGAILKMSYDMWSRIQDRADREQLAKLTSAELEAVKKAGGERETRLVKQIKETRKVALANMKATQAAIRETREFAKVANNVNEKIASIGLELKSDNSKPQDVHVINSPEDPVHIEAVKPNS